MAPKKLKRSLELSIALPRYRGDPNFMPGESITGRVVRLKPISDADTTIKVKLCGRSKVQLSSIGRINVNGMYRSDFNLMADAQEVELYRGPVLLGDEDEIQSRSWQFELAVPAYARFAPVKTKAKDKDLFVAPKRPDILLPASATNHVTTSFMKMVSYVEYWIEASMTDSHGKETTALLPINIVHVPTFVSSHHFSESTRFDFRTTVSSYRLPLGWAAMPLSVPRCIRQGLGLCGVPRFTFRLLVDTPSMLQAGNINYVPFAVATEVIKRKTTRKLRDTFQLLVVRKLRLWITEKREVVVRSLHGPWKHATSKRYTIFRYDDVDPSEDDEESRFSMWVPQPTVDYGERFEIMVPPLPSLNASMETCNVRISHTFDWMLVVQVVGEKRVFKGENPVTMRGTPDPAYLEYNRTVRVVSTDDFESSDAILAGQDLTLDVAQAASPSLDCASGTSPGARTA